MVFLLFGFSSLSCGQEVPMVEITPEMMELAQPAEGVTVELEAPENLVIKWEKYFYLDLTQDLDTQEKTLWVRLGVRKDKIDTSFGWTKDLNGGNGIISWSLSLWW